MINYVIEINAGKNIEKIRSIDPKERFPQEAILKVVCES